MCQNTRLNHLLDSVIPSTTINSCQLGIDLCSRLWKPMIASVIGNFEGGRTLCFSYAWRWVASVVLVSTTGLLGRVIWVWSTVGWRGPGDTARSCGGAVGDDTWPFLVGGVIFVVRSAHLVVGLLEQTL
jgi:hypothetical protein